MTRTGERKGRSGIAAVLIAAAITAMAPSSARAADAAPYDDTLVQLADVLGALHHLRPLCGAPDGQTWREQMWALIEAEQPTPARRARLIDRFNQSYRSLAAAHRSCGPAARELAETFRRRGEELGRDLVTRWGHG